MCQGRRSPGAGTVRCQQSRIGQVAGAAIGAAGIGYRSPMTKSIKSTDGTSGDIREVPFENIVSRAASLLPEELAVSSDDPQAQAEVILLESEERTADPAAGR